MKLLIHLIRKRRAISPVIAVILLIGLAVAATAAIFIVVLPLFQATTDLEIADAFVEYDDDYTRTLDQGVGYGKGTVILTNAGTGSVDVVSIMIYYATPFTEIWTEITNAGSIQGITNNDPYTVNPLATNEELTIRFTIPVENYDNAVLYKIVVTTDEGDKLDTSKTAIVSETDMQLSKDRPAISFSAATLTPSGYIRRTYDVGPTSVSDNSGIKNVTYSVYSSPGGSLIRSKTITSSLWKWRWETYNFSAEGEDNGNYHVIMTVNDYGGLSASTGQITFTIDNDYVKPTITNIMGSSTKNGVDIAEVGESFSVSATITDSGSAVSAVNRAFIYYKLNSSVIYFSTAMLKGSGNTWTGNIPAVFITSEALVKDIDYYIRAIDDDENFNQSELKLADTIDTTEPNFYSHVFEGESITGQPTLVGEENLPLTISVAVEDKDKVSEVFLVWRERNDTTWNRPDPWDVFTNISGTGEVWNFRINSINVTLDGLEYFLNATDPSGNIAYDGSSLSPYRIVIEDEVIPVSTIISEVPLKITAGSDLTVSASVIDNDPTFSWWGSETGTIELGYKRMGDPPLDSSFNYFAIPHIQGDSTLGQTAVWEGTIKGGNFSTTYSPVYIRVRATDNKGLSYFVEKSVAVSAPGIPVLKYVKDSVDVIGASDHILKFEINNSAGGVDPATATVTAIQVELSDNTKNPFIGEPQLVEVNVSGGLNPIWENKSSPSEGTNGVKITLDNTFTILKGSSVLMSLVYANSSGMYFNVNDMTVNATIYYTGGFDKLALFNTPITTFQDFTQTRYMRSDSHTINGLSAYQLGTTNTASFIELNEQTSRWSGSYTVTWGIRVWIRHIDSSETELTSGLVATVQRSSDGVGIQSASWAPTETDLAETDALVIRVYMQIGSSTYGPVEFSTEQLGAVKLLSTSWSVNYYTERDYRGWPQDRTRGIFSWGDNSHNSRITNIRLRALGGGGGGSLDSISSEDSVINPLKRSDEFLFIKNSVFLDDQRRFISFLLYLKRI